MQTQSKLYLPRICNYARDCALRCRSDAAVRQSKIGPVQHIEKLGAKLQAEPLRQGKVFIRAQVPSAKPWPDEDVASGIAECVERGSNKAGCIEECVNRLLRTGQITVTDSIWPGKRAGVRGGSSQRNGKRCTALYGRAYGPRNCMKKIISRAAEWERRAAARPTTQWTS
jgi:hypothetical protein